jgi:hypothetical protein
MGQFKIQRARQKLGFTPSTAVRANIDVRGTGGTGAAVGQALIGGLKIFQQYDNQQANVEFNRFKNFANKEMEELEIRRIGELDPDKYQKDFEETQARIQAGNTGRKRAVAAGNMWLGSKTPGWQSQSIKAQMARSDDNWLAGYSEIAAKGDLDSFNNAKQMLRIKQAGPRPLDATTAERLKNLSEKQLITKQYQDVIDAGGTRKDAFGVIERAVDQGLVSPTEKNTLTENASGYHSRTNNARTNAAKKTTEETYSDLTDSISSGLLEFKDIEVSKLAVKDKEKWVGYVKGSYKQPPIKSDPDASVEAFNAAYGASTKQLTPQEAYDKVLVPRFTPGKKDKMSDKEYKWAIDKIKNPYPPKIAESARTILDSNKALFNKGFNEPKRRQTVNNQFLEWLDGELKDGKSPSPIEMNAMNSQFRVRGGTLVDVGQVVKRGGRDYEVIGFDGDGEPMVEPLD